MTSAAMRQRVLAMAWIALPILVVIALVWELKWWRSLVGRVAEVRAELARTEHEIKATEAEMAREMGALADLLREMQRWSVDQGNPSGVLTRLGELALGARLKITAIGPLERETAPQFRKAWHTVEVLAPYGEVSDLATRLEREGGILEDVSLRLPKEGARPGIDKANEIEARFRLTAMELTPESRAILQRTRVISRAVSRAPAEPEGVLALPLPEELDKAPPTLRDPFAFAVPVEPPTPAKAAELKALAPQKPLLSMEVRGIVSFPGGRLAIVNDQIVKVGDRVAGHRVEDITDNEVRLRQPDGKPRFVRPPNIAAVSPAERER